LSLLVVVAVVVFNPEVLIMVPVAVEEQVD
jgi:NADH:ubiquinone oxidoreductase subunit 3 (subunit A)